MVMEVSKSNGIPCPSDLCDRCEIRLPWNFRQSNSFLPCSPWYVFLGVVVYILDMLIFGFCHSRLRAQLPRGRQGVKDEEGSMPTICGICRRHRSMARLRCSECGEYWALPSCRPEYCWISEVRMCRWCFNQLIAPLPFSGRREVVSLLVVFLEGH